MPEFMYDRDGDVWAHEGDDRWYTMGEPSRTRDEIERLYGPVAPCDADGEKYNPPPDDAVRALVAAAFEDLAERLHLVYYGEEGDTQHLLELLREGMAKTADRIRSGEVTPSTS